MKSAKKLFSEMKSVLVVNSATYAHLVEVKTSDFFVETSPIFRVNISLTRSCCEKSLRLFEVCIISLNRSYFAINFRD